MAVSSPHRTQYEPHVASAHRFEMFGLERKRLTPDQRRRFPIISEPTNAHHILILLSNISLPHLESMDVVRLRSMGMRARPKNPNVNATVTRNWMNTCVPGLT